MDEVGGPTDDSLVARLTETATAYLGEHGYDVERTGSRRQPPAIAVPTGRRARLGDGPVGVEPVPSDQLGPTTVASRLGHALERGRSALFVVEGSDAAARIRSLLDPPTLLAGRTDGYRRFHLGPDRVPVSEGGFACLRGPGAVVWREAGTPAGPVPGSGTDAARSGASTGGPALRLLCEVDGRVRAVLAGVGALSDPPAAAFPYRYRRDPADKQFRVIRTDGGDVVGSFGGVTAMRAAGYHPAPKPLVPEHVLDGSADGRWAILRTDGEPRLLAP